MLGFVQKIRKYDLDKNKFPEDLRNRLMLFNKSYEMFVSTTSKDVEYLVSTGLKAMAENLDFEVNEFIASNINNLDDYRTDNEFFSIQYPDSDAQMLEIKDTTNDTIRQLGIYDGAVFYNKNTSVSYTVLGWELSPYQFKNGVFETTVLMQSDKGEKENVLLHEFDLFYSKTKPKVKEVLTKDVLIDRIELLKDMLDGETNEEKIDQLKMRLELAEEMLNELN